MRKKGQGIPGRSQSIGDSTPTVTHDGDVSVTRSVSEGFFSFRLGWYPSLTLRVSGLRFGFPVFLDRCAEQPSAACIVAPGREGLQAKARKQNLFKSLMNFLQRPLRPLRLPLRRRTIWSFSRAEKVLRACRDMDTHSKVVSESLISRSLRFQLVQSTRIIERRNRGRV